MEIKEIEDILEQSNKNTKAKFKSKELVNEEKKDYGCQKCKCVIFAKNDEELQQAGWKYENGWICPLCAAMIKYDEEKYTQKDIAKVLQAIENLFITFYNTHCLPIEGNDFEEYKEHAYHKGFQDATIKAIEYIHRVRKKLKTKRVE